MVQEALTRVYRQEGDHQTATVEIIQNSMVISRSMMTLSAKVFAEILLSGKAF